MKSCTKTAKIGGEIRFPADPLFPFCLPDLPVEGGTLGLRDGDEPLPLQPGEVQRLMGHGVPLGQALRAVRGDYQQPQKPTAADLRRRVQAWKGQRWAEACRAKHAGRALMGISQALGRDDAAFWQGAKMAADAEDVLLMLESATPAQLLKLASEDL